MTLTPEPHGRVRRFLPVAAAAVFAVAGLAAVAAVLQSAPEPRPSQLAGVLPSGSGTGPTATVSPYDPDGVPFALGGTPILRGPAIEARAARGDATSFLVAGWPTNDPIPSCASNTPYHCGFTSLVDAPGSPEGGRITLDNPDGRQFSFAATSRWVGGFYVLRVRAACSYWHGTCLVVDEALAPGGQLPTTADGFDADGLPKAVDGQRVLRGTEIAAKLASTWEVGPLYVAGKVEAASAATTTTCTDPVTWVERPCPVVRIGDPALGAPLDATSPVFTAARADLATAWEPGALWPDGYVVLRVTQGFVLSTVAPRDAPSAAQTQAPMPSIMVSSMAYNSRVVVEIGGQRVIWGAAIANRLAAGSSTTFLAVGAVGQRTCTSCPAGSVPILVDPPRTAAKGHETAFPLLRADGTAFVLGPPMVWTQPRGIVVLEVRPYAGSCPGGIDCANALEVDAVAVTLPY